MKLGVGKVVIPIVVVVLVVGLIATYVIRSLENAQETGRELERQEIIQDLGNQQEERTNKISKEVERAKDATVEESLDYLRNRQ